MMDQLHQKLIESSSFYRKWHEGKDYHIKHWAIFIAVVILTLVSLTNFINRQIISVDLSQSRAATGTTYTVKQDGTGNFTTIQACANAAKAGDTCLVYPGTYNERVLLSNSGDALSGKITFKSATTRTATVLHGFNTNAKNFVRIEGFNITHDQGGWLGGGIWLASSNVDIVDNYFYDIPGQAISFSWSFSSWANGAPGLWHDIYVAKNYIYRSNKGISIMGRNVLVEDNDIERLVYANEDADYIRFFGENITIRRNYMHGTFQSEIGTSHTDGFQTFDNNGEFAQHVLIEKNIVTGYFAEGFMGEAAFYQNSFDITFRNNIFQGSSAWGLAITDGLKDVKVYNNVFADMAIHGVGLTSGSQAEVYNNIFYNAGTNYWADSTSTLTGGYNLISKTHYPYYQASTDLVNVDPRFVNPASLLGDDGAPFTVDDGFHLQSNSPAIDVGINLSASGLIDDLDGVSRPQGPAWDIGAYEYVSASTPPPPLPPPPGPVTDTTPPVVSITSPVSGATIPVKTPLTISASATDDVSVSKVDFFINGTLKCSDTTSPYACSWKVPGKAGRTYRLQAVSTDTSGNFTASAIVTVTAK